MELRVIACILLNIFAQTIGTTYSVAYDAACLTNTECTDPNTYCKTVNSVCTKGKCRCLDYMEWDSNAGKCKVKKYFLDRCNSTLTDCQGGSECSGVNGDCICNGLTNRYYSTLGKCINSPQILKMPGEDCTTVSDCFVHVEEPASVQCVIPTGSTSTQKKCKCVAGYRSNITNYCRKPLYGEPCTAAVGCRDRVAEMSPDDTIKAVVCSTDNICACPTGSVTGKYYYDGYGIDICVSEYADTAKASGTECDASKECESKICEDCPEDSTVKKCFALD